MWVLLFTIADGCYQTLFCPTSHPWCQKHLPPALQLHFKRPAGMRRAPHFYYIFPPFPFVFLRTAAGLTRPLLSYQQCTKFTLNILNPLSSAQLKTRWAQHISLVAAAPITRDLLSRYLHNPHGSTLQPPGGTASCEEHLFNLRSSWNGVSVTQWLYV